MAKRVVKKRATRPKKQSVSFSKALFEEMLMDVVAGKTLRVICSGPKRPSCPTFLKWIHDDDDRFKQYMRAREISSHFLADEIRELEGLTDAENAAAHRVRFEMKKWDIGRRAPKIFGDKQTVEHTGNEGGPITLLETVIVDPQNDESSS